MQVQFQLGFAYFTVTLNPYTVIIHTILSSIKIVFSGITHLL